MDAEGGGKGKRDELGFLLISRQRMTSYDVGVQEGNGASTFVFNEGSALSIPRLQMCVSDGRGGDTLSLIRPQTASGGHASSKVARQQSRQPSLAVRLCSGLFS